jgi:hypothetical protein
MILCDVDESGRVLMMSYVRSVGGLDLLMLWAITLLCTLLGS